jgi:iron complex transport system permease protein
MAGSHSTSTSREQQGWLTRQLLVFCLGCTAVTVGAGIVQVSNGVFSMTVRQAWAAVFDPEVVFDPATWNAFLLGGELPEMSRRTLVVWNIRLPRVFVAVVAGAALAVSGAIFQAVTRNELASPFILGVSSGAGFAVLASLVLFSGLTPYLPLIAALGGALAFLLVYAIAWHGGTSPVRLVLAGVIVNMIFYSLQQGMFSVAGDLAVVQSAIAWTTGSLTNTGWAEVRMALVPAVVAFLLSLAGARQLNVLVLGERTAKSLGMRVERARFLLSGVAILAASVAIAVAGIVSFFGLVVPHIVRNVVGSDYRRIVFGCLFAGPALMVTADVGARLALGGTQVPVGVVTGVVGGPYFLYLMRTRRTMGEL